MSLFRLFGKKPASLDPAEGNRHVAPGLAAIASGDGAALGALYASLAPADRLHFLDGIGLSTEIGASLPPLNAHPAMTAISGAVHYVWSHRLRGYATADLTSEQQAMDMLEMVAVAAGLLEAAAEETPQDSAVHGFRIRALTLGGGRRDDFDAICRDLAASGVPNVLAELARLNFLAPKWHGSMQEMYALADTFVSAPPNAAFLALKARSVIEEWLYETAMKDEPVGKRAFREKMKSEAFLAEIAALDDQFRDVFGRGPALGFAEAGFAHNNFAVLFTLLRDTRRLKPHLSAIGSAVFHTPWGYVGGRDVPGLVARLRDDCGLAKLKS